MRAQNIVFEYYRYFGTLSTLKFYFKSVLKGTNLFYKILMIIRKIIRRIINRKPIIPGSRMYSDFPEIT